jgi:hypothetical protein
MKAASPAISDTERRLNLDVIRAAVVYGLVFYHTAFLFPIGFAVADDPVTLAMTAFVVFAQLWGMPLLFLVAGSGIWHSLGARTPGCFVRERLSRLLVPLVAGMLLVVPPQIYYTMRASGQDPGSYWSFLGRFFDVRPVLSFPAFLRGDDPDRLFHLAHLWFLYYLLIWTLVLLPVFLYLRRGGGQGLMGWLVARCQGPGGVIVLAVPVAVVEAALGTWKLGGWDGYAYLIFLLYGFLLAADRRLREAVRQQWKRSLAVGVALLPVLYLVASADLGSLDRVVSVDYDGWSIVWRLVKATTGWALTAGIFGLVAALLHRSPRRGSAGADRGLQGSAVAGYARKAVLPFYVLHQTPIVILGFYVLSWRMNVLAEYLAVSLAALVVSLLVYELLVRRFNVTRAMFGMPRR